jgi:hypothetical protein
MLKITSCLLGNSRQQAKAATLGVAASGVSAVIAKRLELYSSAMHALHLRRDW